MLANFNYLVMFVSPAGFPACNFYEREEWLLDRLDELHSSDRFAEISPYKREGQVWLPYAT